MKNCYYYQKQLPVYEFSQNVYSVCIISSWKTSLLFLLIADPIYLLNPQSKLVNAMQSTVHCALYYFVWSVCGALGLLVSIYCKIYCYTQA